MKHTNQKLGIPGVCLVLCALMLCGPATAAGPAVATTTVQGTVYMANGTTGSGTLQLNWPAFTTAANQAVAAGRTNVTIGSDGFVSVKLAPNVGATPAGLYYTAVYHLSDGTTSTEYWVVPAAAQAALAQVRATVMPAAQAVQAVNKAYVDQTIAQATQSQLSPFGGTMSGPLYLNGDPNMPVQAATKHYVDNQFSQTLSINGGAATGPLTATQLGAAYQADQFTGADFGAQLQACINALNATYGGSCDARNFSSTLAMASNVTISKANVTVNLPCATIATGSQIIVTAGTRNVTLHGCASRGTTAASGNQGGTVFLYSGNAAMVQVGDPSYASNTLGFHLDNVVINTTSSTAATAQAITVWRAQEVHLEGLYLLGNANQTGITLDGTGNYTGGTLQDVEIGGFQTAVNAIGHQIANAATTDWVNASTFVRLHIDCPTANGNAIAGTTGINLMQGDGNTFTGGDVESCATALHLGAGAQNNTIVGLRNENSTYQVVADAGSAYNNWITGGTMFTGKLTDNGTRNSFLDTFHRSFNALNGDWFGSQQDATLTNHYRLGIGSGNERGLLHRYQTDSGYRWTMGLSDAIAGEQYYQVLDELNNVYRLSIGQYNTGQASSNNQTVINAAGTGAVVLNGSNNAGSGGVVFGSGGASSSTVATINNAGNAQFNGSLQVSGASTFLNSTTVKNQADAEIDAFLWAGATAPQKESVIYKDWNGNSQWYLVKDASNNWALNSAVGGVDSFKAYQSTNGGDTYIDAANNTGVVRVNYEPGSGSAFNVYGGSSGNLYASFNGTTGIKFPGLAAGSGHSCVQIDNTGYLSNTGSACAGSSVGTGTSGQIAYYPGNGSTLAGMSAIPIGSGGTGSTSASGALASLGGLALAGGTLSGPLTGSSATFSGQVQAQSVALGSDQASGHQAASANAAVTTYSVLAYGAKPDALYKSGVYFQGSMSNGSTTLAVSGVTFTTSDIGKYVSIYGQSAQPFATVAYTGQANWTTSNVAQIAGFIDSGHVQLNKPAINSWSGYIGYGTDNSPGFNACAAAAFAATGGGICMIPPGQYLFATASNYILSGAQDDGSYGTTAGGSGAAITATVSGGSVTGYTVTNGGSNYTPSSSLQMSFSGGCTSAQICGQAYALANTNASGVVTSVTPYYGGFGYTSAPTISVQGLGGDGAAATASISGGSISSIAVPAGGGGYAANSTTAQDWYAMQGTSGCTVIGGGGTGQTPYVAKGTSTTNASGQITGVTITTNATGCTSAPAIVFGDQACNSGTAASPVWGQCVNVAPLAPTPFPTYVYIQPGVSWVGQSGSHGGGATLNGSWDGKTVDPTQPALLGGPIANLDIKGLTIGNALFGILANNNANYAKLADLNLSGGISLYTAATDIGFVVEHMSIGGYATWVNGGVWGHRTDFATGGGGFFDAPLVTDYLARPGAYGGPGSVSQKIDDFFNNYFWHAEFSANSGDFLETCKFPQSPNQRQTGPSMTLPQTANGHCYPGVTSFGMEILTRDNRATGGTIFNTLVAKQISRNIFCCDIGGMQMTAISCEGCSPITGTNDPYRSATTLEGAVKTLDVGQSSSGFKPFINGLDYMGSAINRELWSIRSQGDPQNMGWSNNITGSATNAQPTQNPNIQSNWSFPLGLTLPAVANQYNGAAISFYDYAGLGNPNVLEAQIQSELNGLEILANPTGGSTLSDALDITGSSGTWHVPVIAPGLTINGGTKMTGSAGTGGLAQETTSATKTAGPVAFDANGNTVNATAANVVSLFGTAGTGTKYLGDDGGLHVANTGTGTISGVTPGTGLSGGGTNGSVTLNVTPATSSALGGMKCDGSSTTCDADGTVHASITGGGVLTTSGGQTLSAANTLSGLPTGCTQLPCVVAGTPPTTTSTFTSPASFITYATPSGTGHLYRACYHVDIPTVATAGTFNVYESYYDSSHLVGGYAVGNTSMTSWTYKDGCWQLYADPASNISFTVNFSGVTGSPTVLYGGTLELLK